MDPYQFCSFMTLYRKPPTISPGLIFFRKRFLMAYTRGGGLYTGGVIFGGLWYVWFS